MAIISEDGTGIVGAELYGTIADITAYWTARPHDPRAAIWLDEEAPLENKEGAARESTQYVDSGWGSKFPGIRKTQTQGLQWPRIAGMDGETVIPLTDLAGNELPALPPALLAAVAELAPYALQGSLVEVSSSNQLVKSWTKTVAGESEGETYFEGTNTRSKYDNLIAGLLANITAGSAGSTTWYWL